jgi:predicted DNA-binding transcriptional regulator AlpA
MSIEQGRKVWPFTNGESVMSALQTVDEFCRDNGLSRPMFYKLRRQGKAPRITKLGKLTRISAEAAAEWRRRMEHETVAPAGAR